MLWLTGEASTELWNASSTLRRALMTASSKLFASNAVCLENQYYYLNNSPCVVQISAWLLRARKSSNGVSDLEVSCPFWRLARHHSGEREDGPETPLRISMEEILIRLAVEGRVCINPSRHCTALVVWARPSIFFLSNPRFTSLSS